ncbi:MAG: helix-turn-helix domain-containing protein, partial [Streptococcaceae bacterium]|nr:helix-turn-helix domain-containing protein [Streptococcaceae bacterium]
MDTTKVLNSGLLGMFTTAEKRRLILIETLTSKQTWMELETLAKVADCSLKTLATDFNFIEVAWSAIVKLEQSKKLGVRLHYIRDAKVEHIYQEILRNSQNFEFSERLFFQPFQSEEDWLKELFISESSLYRMVQTINKSYSGINVEIIRRPYYIKAKEERWLRLHFSNYFVKAYGNIIWPFKG